MMLLRFAAIVPFAVAVSYCAVTTPAGADAMVKQYCFGCHNEKLKTGGISLEGASAANIASTANTWEKVLRKVRTGEMPPLNLPRPDADTLSSFLNFTETALDRAALAKPNPGRPSIHRLNRAEYSNAVRDLLALDLDNGASLPADDSGYGFDNIGEVLSISPLHMEKYMSTARRVSRLALGTVKLSPSIEKYPSSRGNDSEDLPLNERGGMVVRRYFALDAEYSILVRVRGNPDPKMPPGRLDLRIDGTRTKLFETVIDQAEELQHTRNFEIRVPLKAGMHVIAAAFLDEGAKLETGVVARPRFGPPPTASPLSVDYITIGGPFNATGAGETESRARIFVCRPTAGQPEEPCAKKIFTTLARRAYRRPLEPRDLEPLMKLYAVGRKDGGSFDSGIEMGLRAILVSPSFLFRVEHTAADSAAADTRRVTDLELASRLSFFLWSTIPDEELLSLAEKNKLRPVLGAQVKRMLADPKSKALIDNFAGQWLHLRNIANWRPDPDKFPQFDDSLRVALQRETEMFFRYIVKEDRSVLDFINADYSFLNERLARHYGIKGVRGAYFRQVALNNPERGGILTQGAILTVTSYPTRTSPVLRGKWILENVLGAPPPPPPPDVPDLADSANKSAKDLRAALEQHRAKAACASCHSRLDPLGFSLENYDATGKFRSSEGGAVIDASGSLPGGINVDGSPGLKKVLMDHRDEFVECLAEKLLTYALGRGLEHYDLPAVRAIRRQASADDYRFSSLALAIVNSVPFQMRRTPEK